MGKCPPSDYKQSAVSDSANLIDINRHCLDRAGRRFARFKSALHQVDLAMRVIEIEQRPRRRGWWRVFNNRVRMIASLSDGLRQRFHEVEIERQGCVALFRAA